ncbi:nitroreductase [Ferrovibrio sp.]|uniref:nitroreductase n=1 Tax=Ferrovibrio sp. TaxID=1917215 RepID=UPI003D0A2EC3
MDDYSTISPVDDAILSRRSCRSYLDRPVPASTVREILDLAAHAANGHNAQPWKVEVLSGQSLKRFCEETMAVFEDKAGYRQLLESSNMFLADWSGPYMERRRETGRLLFDSLGIKRDDVETRYAQMGLNYSFFGAPVGLVIGVEKAMERSTLEIGMFAQTLMIAARARGLDTCTQAAFAIIGSKVREILGLPEGFRILCGMALGYADEAHPVNSFRTPRLRSDQFATFHD